MLVVYVMLLANMRYILIATPRIQDEQPYLGGIKYSGKMDKRT